MEGVFGALHRFETARLKNSKLGSTVKYFSVLHLGQIPGPELSCEDSVQPVVKLCHITDSISVHIFPVWA